MVAQLCAYTGLFSEPGFSQELLLGRLQYKVPERLTPSYLRLDQELPAWSGCTV